MMVVTLSVLLLGFCIFLQKINEKMSVVAEYESTSASAIPNQRIIAKMERALGMWRACLSAWRQFTGWAGDGCLLVTGVLVAHEPI